MMFMEQGEQEKQGGTGAPAPPAIEILAVGRAILYTKEELKRIR
jgi:hypothetical protein